MEYLTIEYIKEHSRLDYDCEDAVLELYANSAEMSIAQLLNRGKTVAECVASLKEEFGEVPAPIIHAALMLVDNGYEHRSPTTKEHAVQVLYTFDFNIKPFMNL